MPPAGSSTRRRVGLGTGGCSTNGAGREISHHVPASSSAYQATAYQTVTPCRVSDAPGTRANSRIAAIMYSAGGQAIHAHSPASPGAAMSSPAAMPDVTPTIRNEIGRAHV